MSNRTAASASPAEDEALKTVALAESLSTADTVEEPRTPEIAANAKSLLNAAKLKVAMRTARDNASLVLTTVAFAGALAGAPNALGAKLESPYEPLAANGNSIVLVEKERVKLEREFSVLLEKNGKGKYLEFYGSLDAPAKDKVAKGYGILKSKNLEERKTAAAVAALIESALGVKNAKIIIREWTQNKKDANVESYTVAQKIKSVAKFAPEILELYNLAELEEIDRLQKSVYDAIVAQNRQEIAQTDQRIAQNRQEIAQLKENIAKLEALLKKY